MLVKRWVTNKQQINKNRRRAWLMCARACDKDKHVDTWLRIPHTKTCRRWSLPLTPYKKYTHCFVCWSVASSWVACRATVKTGLNTEYIRVETRVTKSMKIHIQTAPYSNVDHLLRIDAIKICFLMWLFGGKTVLLVFSHAQLSIVARWVISAYVVCCI